MNEFGHHKKHRHAKKHDTLDELIVEPFDHVLPKHGAIDELKIESFDRPIPTTDPRIEIRNGEFCFSQEGREFLENGLKEALAPFQNVNFVFPFGPK